MKKTIVHSIKTLFLIFIACLICAIGFDWFYVPNEIGSSGVTGIAQIINHIFPDIPIGICLLVLNIPLFIIGLKFFGVRLLATTIYTTVLLSVLTDLVNLLVDFQPMDPFLATSFGGVLSGIGMGIIFQQGATTGGTDLVAKLLKLKFPWLTMGKLLLAVDIIIIVMVGIAFRKVESTLTGIVAMYIISITMDWILYGTDKSKLALIISEKEREITAAIDSTLGRGITILYGEGGYTGAPKRILMCAFKQRQIMGLKAAVKEADPDAFIVVCDAYDVFGDGFKEYKKDEI